MVFTIFYHSFNTPDVLWKAACKPNIYVSWSTSELRVRLAPLNRFKPSSKIFYWPFQGGTSFVDLLCFCSVLSLLCFVHVCLYVLRGHLLGKGWPLGSRLWCLLWVCHFPIGILGQVWYLIVSIPDLCNLTYFGLCFFHEAMLAGSGLVKCVLQLFIDGNKHNKCVKWEKKYMLVL